MCNINLLHKGTGELSFRDLAFLEIVTRRSFAMNNHGEGYVSPQWYHTSPSKIIFFDEDKLVGQEWIATHERLATHGGKDLKNIQPIVLKELTLLHNGMLDLDHDKKSDSRMLAERIQKTRSKKPDKKFSEILKAELAKDIGTKSILINDHNTGRLWYYKNWQTDFYICFGADGQLFASTDKENCRIASDYLGYGDAGEVAPDRLFEIENGELKDYGKVKDTPRAYLGGYYSNWESSAIPYGELTQSPKSQTPALPVTTQTDQKDAEDLKKIIEYLGADLLRDRPSNDSFSVFMPAASDSLNFCEHAYITMMKKAGTEYTCWRNNFLKSNRWIVAETAEELTAAFDFDDTVDDYSRLEDHLP